MGQITHHGDNGAMFKGPSNGLKEESLEAGLGHNEDLGSHLPASAMRR